ncbi:hypothetical protein LOK49_LG03G03861 [Camellia lanceoleosa]|uniref:Uncharacterized protein n=1 Tax=Camellia lanceoleosa TaxID=1840588 RepID=A0ACC0IBU4_9ERIC|nr:hypothetical protein LOK49_LG03G03861 [Camellia lanceoleosa]
MSWHRKKKPHHRYGKAKPQGQMIECSCYLVSSYWKSVVVVESVTKARSGSVRPDDDFSIVMVWEVPSAAWTHLPEYQVHSNYLCRSVATCAELDFLDTRYIAKTLYGDDDDEDVTPENNGTVEEPKLLGLHPGLNEKILLKNGPPWVLCSAW